MMVLVGLLFLICFLQIIISPFNYFFYIYLGLVFFPVLFSFIKQRKFSKEIILIIGLYNAPFLSGLIFGLPYGLLDSDSLLKYHEINIIGRVFNLLFFSILIIYVYTITIHRDNRSFLKLMRFYWFGCFLLLLTGLWQALAHYTGIISFPFDTRSHLHSASDLELSIDFRLTGLAQEPSYFVTFLVDFLLLTFIVINNKRKYIYILIALLCLFLTFSPSGFILLVGSAICTFFLYLFKFFRLRFNVRTFFLILLLLSASAIALSLIYNTEFFNYIYHRIVTSGDSGRFITINKVLKFFGDSSVYPMFFGYGLKSFSLLPTIGLLSNETSNNILVDVLFESGLIGVILLLLFYIYLLIGVLRIKNKKIFILSSLLFFNMLISSMFKADYAILRIFVLIFFITYLSNRVEYTQNIYKNGKL